MIAYIKDQLTLAGKFSLFIGRFFRELFIPPFQFNEFIRQCYTTGYKSHPLVSITGFIMGFYYSIETYNDKIWR